MYKDNKILRQIIFFLAITLVLFTIIGVLYDGKKEKEIVVLNKEIMEYDEFRAHPVNRELYEACINIQEIDADKCEIMAICMLYSSFNCNDTAKLIEECKSQEDYEKIKEKVYKKNSGNEEKIDEYILLCKALLEDIHIFPISYSGDNIDNVLSYYDSWNAERTYVPDKKNEVRTHEGTDIMLLNNIRGYYPVVSMCDGIVENMGWLELGGYRLGIRSENGLYLYYAHLYSYDSLMSVGSEVKAGQIVGYAGDSGYSKVEGTVGNFDVHLHVGIYYEDVSMNPFEILSYIEKRNAKFIE